MAVSSLDGCAKNSGFYLFCAAGDGDLLR